MDSQLEVVITQLKTAKFPEDVFGLVDCKPDELLQSLKEVYRHLVKVTHPDKYSDALTKEQAGNAFVRLNALWEDAQTKVEKGIYGSKKSTPGSTAPTYVVVKVRRKEFKIRTDVLVATGDKSDFYPCSYNDGVDREGVIKIVRDPLDNDLAQNEAAVLKELWEVKEDKKYHPYLPQIVHSFNHRGRAATVFAPLNGFYNLTQIRDYYKTGVAAKDMAWMWRRLLVVLGYIHTKKLVHGAVLPNHLLFHPEQHGLVLVDWAYAVKDSPLKAVSTPYEKWYPKEVLAKEIPTSGVDIFMGAKCMIYVLGGDPIAATFPSSVPKKLQSFYKGCLLTSPPMRPQYAWELLKEFDELIEQLYGPRKFHPFYMPTL